MLSQLANFVIANSTCSGIFSITVTKLYVEIVTFSTQVNIKLLQQLKSGFNWTIHWNKYQSKIQGQAQNQYLDYLIDPSFLGACILFVKII